MSAKAIVMFSGGLDSLLAAKLLQEQGIEVICLHFTTPFFGSAAKVPHWRETHGLNIEAMDASEPFAAMLANYPPHGVGKTLNPCVDCKITLLRLAKEEMARRGASFVATGEVLGQRPMSQRSDALNAIERDSGLSGLLLRPLCARAILPTPMEASGQVDRERLLKITGRGRNQQLELASEYGVTEIPTPGGGCRLTEIELARRYWPLLKPLWRAARSRQEAGDGASHAASAIGAFVADSRLVNLGNVVFNENGRWLAIGRDAKDNERLLEAASPEDFILKLPFPGPLAVARRGKDWPEADFLEACAILASHAKAGRLPESGQVAIRACEPDKTVVKRAVVPPDRLGAKWRLPSWQEAHEEIKAERKAWLAMQT